MAVWSNHGLSLLYAVYAIQINVSSIQTTQYTKWKTDNKQKKHSHICTNDLLKLGYMWMYHLPDFFKVVKSLNLCRPQTAAKFLGMFWKRIWKAQKLSHACRSICNYGTNFYETWYDIPTLNFVEPHYFSVLLFTLKTILFTYTSPLIDLHERLLYFCYMCKFHSL